jgi:hypothetical protein
MDMAEKPDGAGAPKAVVINLGEAEPDTLRVIGGSKSDRYNNAIIEAVAKTAGFPLASQRKIAASRFLSQSRV